MSRKLTARLVALMMVCLMAPLSAKEQVFNQSTFKQLKQEYGGKPWILLVWSVDCPPCFKELAMVKELLTLRPQLPIVLLNADGEMIATTERQQIINQFDLSALKHFYFADGQVQSGRYQLDPNWHGELPRSYFFDTKGEYRAKSGLVSKALIAKWLGL